MGTSETGGVRLRDVVESDLEVFFAHQLDPEANRMAAFTREDPADREGFMAHWRRIMADETVAIQTVLAGEEVAGHVLRYEMDGRPEVSYWLGRGFWGRGIATAALALFVASLPDRPLYARAARDNVASLRVLEKCGFVVTGSDRGFANARGEEIEEAVLMLT